MRPSQKIENPVLIDTTKGLASLSIVIDDFDSAKTSTNSKEMKMTQADVSTSPPTCSRIYARQSSDESFKKILEEAEHRRHEFWKLIEEYSEVVENIKKIEQSENKSVAPIKT